VKALEKVLLWQRNAQRRHLAIATALAMPLLLFLFALCIRYQSAIAALILLAVSASSFFWYQNRTRKTFNQAWLIRKLDQHQRALEDSSDLLFEKNDDLSGLQLLQKNRVENVLSDSVILGVREKFPWQLITLSWLLGLGFSCLLIFWPQAKTQFNQILAQTQASTSVNSKPIELLESSLYIRPPLYTGLAARSEKIAGIKFPEGAALQWKLKFNTTPESVKLAFYDGSKLALQRSGDHWQGSKTLMQSSLYRIEVTGGQWRDDTLHRLDVIKDNPPSIRVLQPVQNLSLVKTNQATWPLRMAAEDDYGVGPVQLSIRLAQGSGENIDFKEQSLILSGQGNRQLKQFSHTLNLASLGVGPGDDVIVQFSVRDQRTPQPNITLSSSYILRWPPSQSAETTSVEGMVKKVMPAYFRSQRQIIIDTEKLLVDRNKLSAEQFAIRSDEIGVDQRILRLRYGQFLGEESEQAELPTNDADQKTDHDEHDDESEHADTDAHAHEHGDGDTARKKDSIAATPNDRALLEEFGHTHDIPEAATLIDPETKKLLRAALNEMWQAELHLRQAEPKKALPYENRALLFIKKVQQADRIYLARTGLELAPIDETRRLTGDRTRLTNTTAILATVSPQDQALIEFWLSLNALEISTSARNSSALNYSAMRGWIRENPSRIPDTLGVFSALDALERQPNCGSCLQEVKTQLWPMLPRPPANPRLRVIPDRQGQSYLDALHQEHRP
jgi:hypothetical protein